MNNAQVSDISKTDVFEKINMIRHQQVDIMLDSSNKQIQLFEQLHEGKLTQSAFQLRLRIETDRMNRATQTFDIVMSLADALRK